MQIDNSVLIIKSHHYATIRHINETNKRTALAICFETRNWKKKFPGVFRSIERAKKEVRKIGFNSFVLKDNTGKALGGRSYFSPWWKVNETDRDWKLIYLERQK